MLAVCLRHVHVVCFGHGCYQRFGGSGAHVTGGIVTVLMDRLRSKLLDLGNLSHTFSVVEA